MVADAHCALQLADRQGADHSIIRKLPLEVTPSEELSRSKVMAKKKQMSKREKRKLRTQQIVFIIISLMIVLAMVLSMIVN